MLYKDAPESIAATEHCPLFLNGFRPGCSRNVGALYMSVTADAIFRAHRIRARRLPGYKEVRGTPRAPRRTT
jgi:hypothetical protein